MDWDHLRHFLALAREGSARAAGAALGVSHSTVLRRVEALEAHLSARLFDRHRDGYLLTEAGRQVLGRAERAEAELAALERDVVGQDERLAGSVSVTCCDDFVSDLLVRELARFCSDYPDISLGLVTDSRSFDLSKREADLAVRILGRGVDPPEHLLGRRLGPVVVGSYVATAHAGALDPERPGSAARWVAFDDEATTRALVASSSYPELPVWGAFASLPLLLQAAENGLGLVMLPTYVGDRQPGLQRMPRPDLRHVADLWLLCHPDLRDNARLRAARERIRSCFARHAPLFRGEDPGGRCVRAPLGPEFTPNNERTGDVG